MDRQELIRNIMAGIFFLGGIILIGMFIFTIGRNKGLAEPKFQMTVLFKNVGGLNAGAPVRLAGVTVGNVEAIDFLDDDVDGRRVKVTLNIFDKYKKQIKKSTTFAIRTEGILGEKLIESYVDEDKGAVDITKPVIGIDPVDVQDLAVVFSDAAESFTKTAQELSEIDMVELAEVMTESSKALLVTSEGINDILQEMDEIGSKSKRLFDRIEQRVIEGDLFKVF